MGASKQIFISYARVDREKVNPIVAALESAGYSIFIDRDIRGGMNWRHELGKAIRDAKVILLALSPNSEASPNVRKELRLSDDYSKNILQVRIAETELSDEAKMLLASSGSQFIEWYRMQSLEQGVEELQLALTTLGVKPNDEVSPPPRVPIWRTAPAILGVTAVFASVAIYASAVFGRAATVVPTSLTPLQPASSLGSQAIGLSGLLTIMVGLAVLSGRWKSLRGAFGGLAAFLALTMPVAIWNRQYLAAAFGAASAASICAWWIWKSRLGVTPRALTAQAGILLGAALVGSTAHYLLLHRPLNASIIGMAPFELVVDDDELKSKQADHSNKLRLKLAAVFSGAGLSVVPNIFDARAMDDWSFDNWRVSKAGEVEPYLLLRTWIRRCARVRQNVDATQPASYVWLAVPYGQNLEPFSDFVNVVGSDTAMLALQVAFEMLTAAPFSNKLTLDQRQDSRRVIVVELRDAARARGFVAEEQAAAALLSHPTIADEQIHALFNRLNSEASLCDEVAAANRNALAAKVGSYTTTPSPEATAVANP